MIVLTNGISESWKNIRAIIFNNIIKRLTLPLEASTLLGISFFETFVKPIYKIREKYKTSNQIEIVNYLNKAIKKNTNRMASNRT